MSNRNFVEFFSEGTVRPIPEYKRWRLREELAKELSAARQEAGLATLHALARAARVSINTIGALESVRRTKDYVTVLSLHRIAAALSRSLDIKVEGVEKYFPPDTSVETLFEVGANISFTREG